MPRSKPGFPPAFEIARRPTIMRCARSRCRRIVLHDPIVEWVNFGTGGIAISLEVEAWRCTRCGRVRF